MIATSDKRAEFLAGDEAGLEGRDRLGENPERQEPSEKAFEVFHLVEVVGLSTRQAAQEVGLSQTRVIQLRDAVEDWLASRPSRHERFTRQQRLRITEYTANARLDHLYSQALTSWHASQGREYVQYGNSDGKTRTIVRHCHGKVMYLNAAMRVVAAQAKLAVTLAKAAEEKRSGKPVNAAEGESQEQVAAVTAATPSEEDCSPAAAQPDGCGEARRAGGDVNGSAAEACNSTAEPVSAVSRVNRVESSPVQPASALVERLNQLPVERVLEGLPLTDRIRQEAAKRVGDPRQQRRKAFLSGK
jgi:hypothetical protein